MSGIQRRPCVASRASRSAYALAYPQARGRCSTPKPTSAAADPAGYRTVAMIGVLDLATAALLQTDLYRLIDAGHVRLVVDLSRVSLCEASIMGMLVRARRHSEQRGGWLRLAHPVGLVARSFRIVAFGRDVEVYPTAAAAAGGDEQDRIMR